MKLLHLLAIGLLSAGLAAQTCATKYYDNNSPTGGRNAFPWGSAGLRYQSIVPAATLGTTPFTITGLRIPGDTASTAPVSIRWNRLEIRIGKTTVTTPGSNWDTNNPNPVVVHDGPASVTLSANTWSDLKLAKPFCYDGTGNLCVEVITWDVVGRTTPSNFLFPANSAAIGRAFRYNWVNNQTQAPLTGTGGGKFGILCGASLCSKPATRVFYGAGCGNNPSGPMGVGNTHVLPKVPSTGNLVGRWGPSSSRGVYLVGAGRANIDLGPLGAPGCTALVNLSSIVQLPCTFDSSGNASAVPFDIPCNASLCGGGLNVQLVALWPRLNALQVATSNAIEFVLGN